MWHTVTRSHGVANVAEHDNCGKPFFYFFGVKRVPGAPYHGMQWCVEVDEMAKKSGKTDQNRQNRRPQVGVTLPQDVYDFIVERAASEERTVSKYCEILLRSKVEELKNGGLSPIQLGEPFLNEDYLNDLTARMDALKAAIERKKDDA